MSIASCQSFTGWQTDEWTERNREAVRLTDWLTESINQFINVLFNVFFLSVFFSLTSFLYKRLSLFLLFLILTPLSLSLSHRALFLHTLLGVWSWERERENVSAGWLLLSCLVSHVQCQVVSTRHAQTVSRSIQLSIQLPPTPLLAWRQATLLLPVFPCQVPLL